MGDLVGRRAAPGPIAASVGQRLWREAWSPNVRPSGCHAWRVGRERRPRLPRRRSMEGEAYAQRSVRRLASSDGTGAICIRNPQSPWRDVRKWREALLVAARNVANKQLSSGICDDATQGVGRRGRGSLSAICLSKPRVPAWHRMEVLTMASSSAASQHGSFVPGT